jgi:hypothetical protein
MTIRRLKTYTGSQGYVYQYYFVGKRPARTPNAKESDAHEYIFDVTSDRKLTYAVSIFLPHQVVAAWAESHRRPLGDSEQYAGRRASAAIAGDASSPCRIGFLTGFCVLSNCRN